MSGNVFEQYQKYYESLITRQKSNCQLENQNYNHEAVKPTAQKTPQAMPQNPALPQQQQQVQYMTPVYPQQQAKWARSDPEMSSSSLPAQQYDPQKQGGPQPQLYYGPDGSGYYYCSDVVYNPFQQQQPQFSMQPLYAPYCAPENFYQVGGAFPTTPAPYPVQAQYSFKPDGSAEAAVAPDYANQNTKKPVFCYPNSVNGFQGGFPCSPCSSCKTTRQSKAITTPALAATGTLAAPLPCEGNKNCPSGWPPFASGEQPASFTADKEEDRLPLGVDEPFVVGPTSYQYFYG